MRDWVGLARNEVELTIALCKGIVKGVYKVLNDIANSDTVSRVSSD